MLETDKFPAEYLTKFTKQVNNWLGDMIQSGHIPAPKKRPLKPNKPAGSAKQPGVGSYRLGERFVMLFMNDPEVQAVKSLDRDLSELVARTGRRHYQIKENGDAVAYARSVINDQESLCQLFATKLAGDVQTAIKKLDAYESKHPGFAAQSWRVRLVTIPTFHTHAFLIQRIQEGDQFVTSGSYVYVISAPKWLNKLPTGKMLNSRQFLLGFKGKRPIIGVRSQNSDQQAKEQMNMQKKQKTKANSPDSKNLGVNGGADDPNTGSTPVLGKPLFASLIFPYVMGSGVGGGVGHIGALGGPPEGVDPLFVVFSYPVPPKKDRDITDT